MAKKLKFGGPNLKGAQETWYRHVNPDGSLSGQPFVKEGAVVDYDRVLDAQYYIDNGMATVVDVVGPMAVPPAPTDKKTK
jgi:hypothetical protein